MSVVTKSPQLQIYDITYIASLDLGYSTYDYLPDESAGLPFVFIGEQFSQDRANKSTVNGNVQQTIHVYGSHKQRRQVAEMIGNLRHEIRKLKHTDNFYITVVNMNDQIIIDNSTPTTLLHGMLEVEFSFN